MVANVSTLECSTISALPKIGMNVLNARLRDGSRPMSLRIVHAARAKR
jgi:hypothetical protein